MPGVIALEGRYAVPSVEGMVCETVGAIENLNLNSNLLGENDLNGRQDLAKPARCMRVRAKSGLKSKRGRRVKKLDLTPGQKLISNMFGKDENVPKGEKEKK